MPIRFLVVAAPADTHPDPFDAVSKVAAELGCEVVATGPAVPASQAMFARVVEECRDRTAARKAAGEQLDAIDPGIDRVHAGAHAACDEEFDEPVVVPADPDDDEPDDVDGTPVVPAVPDPPQEV